MNKTAGGRITKPKGKANGGIKKNESDNEDDVFQDTNSYYDGNGITYEDNGYNGGIGELNYDEDEA